MKRLAVLLAIVLFSVVARAGATNSAALTTTTCPGTGCVQIQLPYTDGTCTVSVTISGAATVVFETAIAGGAFTAQTLYDNLGNGASSATATGSYSGPCAGALYLRARCSVLTNGTVVATVSSTAGSNLSTPGPIGGTTPSTGVFTQVFGVSTTANGTADGSFTEAGTVRTPSVVADTLDASGSISAAFFRYSASATRAPVLYFNRAGGGTPAIPTIVASGAQLGRLQFDGYDGAQWQTGAQILATATGTPAAGKIAGTITLATTDLTGNAHNGLIQGANGNLTWAIPTEPSTNLTASTEFISYNFNDSSTKTFPAGDFAKQRGTVIQAPTYAAVGASTITTASTLDITGAPTCNSNMTCTNAYAFNIEAGTANLAGAVKVGGALTVASTASSGTCTLNGGTPSTCTATVTAGTICLCSEVGATAIIAAAGCAVGLSGTTLTVTGAATASNVVNYHCF